MNHGLVIAAGVFNLVLGAFHVAFWRLFRWREDLATLGAVNRAIVQVMNLALIYAFAMAGFVCLLFPDALAGTALGRAFLLGWAGFWLVRAFWQPVFFGFRHPASVAMTGVFLLGAGLHVAPAFGLAPGGDTGRVNVLLPPGYDEAGQQDVRCPVLYLLDGVAGVDTALRYPTAVARYIAVSPSLWFGTRVAEPSRGRTVGSKPRAAHGLAVDRALREVFPGPYRRAMPRETRVTMRSSRPAGCVSCKRITHKE